MAVPHCVDVALLSNNSGGSTEVKLSVYNDNINNNIKK